MLKRMRVHALVHKHLVNSWQFFSIVAWWVQKTFHSSSGLIHAHLDGLRMFGCRINASPYTGTSLGSYNAHLACSFKVAWVGGNESYCLCFLDNKSSLDSLSVVSPHDQPYINTTNLSSACRSTAEGHWLSLVNVLELSPQTSHVF